MLDRREKVIPHAGGVKIKLFERLAEGNLYASLGNHLIEIAGQSGSGG
jgi:hypothetical protein